MTRMKAHTERHAVDRIGWLRAAVLGANDGIVSTASLIVGVAAASPDKGAVLLAGTAALVAGSMSMAAGEYVSVSSQADAEQADLKREAQELADDPVIELNELTAIYIQRGLEPDLARKVAEQLTAKDALGAHARDELHITDMTAARPLQAAVTSALTFAAGAILPLAIVLLVGPTALVWAVSFASLLFLAALGAIGARIGKAHMVKGFVRVTFWGAAAMALTAGIGAMFGAGY